MITLPLKGVASPLEGLPLVSVLWALGWQNDPYHDTCYIPLVMFQCLQLLQLLFVPAILCSYSIGQEYISNCTCIHEQCLKYLTSHVH